MQYAGRLNNRLHPRVRIQCEHCGAVHLDWFASGCRGCKRPLPCPYPEDLIAVSDPAADCTRAAANLLADAIKEGVADDPAELRPILDKLVEAVAHKVIAAFIDAKRNRRL